jgi:transcriptional regulator with XRE-family HTH domain
MIEAAPSNALPERIEEALAVLNSRGIKQAEVARRLGVKPQSIVLWKRTGRIRLPNLEALAALSGFQVSYLTGRDGGGAGHHRLSEPLGDYVPAAPGLQRMIDQAVAERTRRLEGDVWSLRASLATIVDFLLTTPGVAAELRERQLRLLGEFGHPEYAEKHFQGVVSKILERAIARDEASATRATG